MVLAMFVERPEDEWGECEKLGFNGGSRSRSLRSQSVRCRVGWGVVEGLILRTKHEAVTEPGQPAGYQEVNRAR